MRLHDGCSIGSSWCRRSHAMSKLDFAILVASLAAGFLGSIAIACWRIVQVLENRK